VRKDLSGGKTFSGCIVVLEAWLPIVQTKGTQSVCGKMLFYGVFFPEISQSIRVCYRMKYFSVGIKRRGICV
jgi:hypothetical protein